MKRIRMYLCTEAGLIDSINEDDEVSFEIKDGQKGLNAVDVKLAR